MSGASGIMYQSNRSFNIPPRQPPGHLNFWKFFWKIPPSPGRQAVQMPPPLGKLPDYCLKLFSSFYYVPVKSKLQHPPSPGQPPGICIFCKIFVQIPPSRGRKGVQMPHHRTIPGDQMPPPPGNFSVAFIMLRKLCMY